MNFKERPYWSAFLVVLALFAFSTEVYSAPKKKVKKVVKKPAIVKTVPKPVAEKPVLPPITATPNPVAKAPEKPARQKSTYYIAVNSLSGIYQESLQGTPFFKDSANKGLGLSLINTNRLTDLFISKVIADLNYGFTYEQPPIGSFTLTNVSFAAELGVSFMTDIMISGGVGFAAYNSVSNLSDQENTLGGFYPSYSIAYQNDFLLISLRNYKFNFKMYSGSDLNEDYTGTFVSIGFKYQ